MKKPSRLFAVVVLLVLGVACGLYLKGPAVAQEKEKPKEKAPAAAKWEYRDVTLYYGQEKVAEKELNKLGDEGFEVAFATSAPVGQLVGLGGVPAGGPSCVVHYTLKRAKQ